MVNLEWYRTFKEVYKTGTLTKAAAALFISQPGVSLHLSALENYVGYKLFDRTGRKMVPTEKGKVLYNFIIEPLAKLEEAEKNFQKSTEKNTPTISIGMCFETFQITLEQYISSLPFNVIIQFGEYPDMVENLEKGILDLIITPQMVVKNGIEYQEFSSETIVLVGGNEIDTTEFNDIEKKASVLELEQWLKQQKWYGTTGDMEHLRHFWQLNFNKHPDFRPNYIVPNLNSIVRCLSSGKGLAVVPDFLCRKEIESGLIKLIWEGKTPLTNILYFATRKKTMYEEEIQKIKQIFIELN
ncbi:LysR family transcriptional regulator [Flavobacterium degerlachei]|jgi:DNA-binding transcriptional LysR family regulator|uniref:DNA-binding transcriptional regulator, LysR family n=1 Tax=Flavobacterium degerlachei TaxID=229203 RepID=A0A1H3EXT7_9FLAO|nr:LysR family transcriptional regulator [Flavobacterium degerlachei]SDX83551.1 DNA-binding transcriptional regulator, LysR family [Flavobacterium degerlachei]